jgi:PadR family transcriptional regulator PadR
MTRDSIGEVEHLVLLAIVRVGENSYGVPIRAEIDRRAGREVAFGALYTCLDRLARKGYVQSRLSKPTPERGGKARRCYRLTPTGARALRNARGRLMRMWDGVSSDLNEVLL